MTEHPTPEEPDTGLRLMLKWVLIAFVAVVLLAILVVEFTMRWFGSH